jgi:DNA repair photolyase
MHACAYCYARPSHQFLDFGAGTDFDRKIVVKRAAASLLRDAFMKSSWKGELILFSGNTDCYQPLEATHQITRSLLKVCAEYRNPVGIITKASLIERDIDVLTQLNQHAACAVTLSIPFMDPNKCRLVEPFAPTPARRFKTIRRLVDAGIRVGVNVAPIIPGLNDEDIPQILESARQAGATRAGHILVRLPGPVEQVFEERIRNAFPGRADRIFHRIEDCRGGRRTDNRFGVRMHGSGAYWEAIETLYLTTCKRLGFDNTTLDAIAHPRHSTFKRPPKTSQQLSLFENDPPK